MRTMFTILVLLKSKQLQLLFNTLCSLLAALSYNESHADFILISLVSYAQCLQFSILYLFRIHGLWSPLLV